MDRAVAGELESPLDTIDDYVQWWHDLDGQPRLQTLHDYLGLTWEEYSHWAQNPNSLMISISKRKNTMSTTAVTVTLSAAQYEFLLTKMKQFSQGAASVGALEREKGAEIARVLQMAAKDVEDAEG